MNTLLNKGKVWAEVSHNTMNFNAAFTRIYLGKEAQGKGVAQKLFDWLENKAKDTGDNLVWLKAMDTQKQAL